MSRSDPFDGLTPQQIDDLLNGWHDHDKWCRETIQIRDKTGATVPLQQSASQRKLSVAITEQERRGLPVRGIILKARQVHFSVGSCSHIFKRTCFKAGQQGMVFGDTYRAAKNLWGYLKQYDDSYLPFSGKILKPQTIQQTTPSMTSAGRLAWANDSWIETNTAKNVAAGRSYSIRHLLLSEYAFYADAGALMTGLLQCVPDDSGTTVLIESTANGKGGPFYRRWQEVCDPVRATDWFALFFAWWEHPEYSRQIERVEAFERSLTKEECALRQAHNLTLEQLHWRRWAIENKCEGSIERFHQEFPSTPEEAFLTSGRPRFCMVSLGRAPIIRDPLAGELERVNVGTRSQVQFVPREDSRGRLRVWKRPREGALYVIGADPSQGIDVSEDQEGQADPDYSVGQVLDQDTGEQVAVLRDRLTPSAFGQYLVDLAEWYNWAFIVPEAVDVALVEELLRQQYPLGLLYQRQRMADDRRSATLQELGFKTTNVSRPQIISSLDRSIREASLIVRDQITLDELQSFVYKSNGRAEAQQGCHDDCVMALALANHGLATAPRERRMRTDRPLPAHTDEPRRYGQMTRKPGYLLVRPGLRR